MTDPAETPASSERSEPSALFSLASLARSANAPSAASPALTRAPDEDSSLIVLAAPGAPTEVLPAPGIAPLPAAPLAPLVAPPLGLADPLGTPLPTVQPPRTSALGQGRAGWLFPLGGVSFALLALAFALASGSRRQTAEPALMAAVPPAVSTPLAPSRPSDPLPPEPSAAASLATPVGAAPSASASSVPLRSSNRGQRGRRPPAPPSTTTAPPTTTARPPPARDPCARCGTDLACNIACKAGG